MRTPVALLAALLIPIAAGSAQRAAHAAVDFGAGAIRISFDQPVARDRKAIDKLIGRREGWSLGGMPGAVLATTAPYRFDRSAVPAGLYAVALQRDAYATWLVLTPLEAIDRPRPGAAPLRIPMLEASRDSVIAALRVTIDAGNESSETIVFGYDKKHEATIDRYSISTEPNRPIRRLVVDWDHYRWSVPISGADSTTAPR